MTDDRFFTSNKTRKAASWSATENITSQVIERWYKIIIAQQPRNHYQP
ncbi:hypothetical protein QUA86_04615 [Microcoleus sp. F6_B6]